MQAALLQCFCHVNLWRIVIHEEKVIFLKSRAFFTYICFLKNVKTD